MKNNNEYTDDSHIDDYHTGNGADKVNKEMEEVVICKYCGVPEYYGEMRWLSGKCCCRDCYKKDYEERTGKKYTWDDLDGKRPTIEIDKGIAKTTE